jgi:putative holliday junction resolvase
MRYLGIDYGTRRTGLAICDADETLVSPLECIDTDVRRPERLMEHLKQIVADNQVSAVVVGLPLNMDDSAGPQAEQAKQFADRVQRSLGVAVHLQDERLSSAAADEKLAQISGLSRRRKKTGRNMLAACEILQDFIDRLHQA